MGSAIVEKRWTYPICILSVKTLIRSLYPPELQDVMSATHYAVFTGVQKPTNERYVAFNTSPVQTNTGNKHTLTQLKNGK